VTTPLYPAFKGDADHQQVQLEIDADADTKQHLEQEQQKVDDKTQTLEPKWQYSCADDWADDYGNASVVYWDGDNEDDVRTDATTGSAAEKKAIEQLQKDVKRDQAAAKAGLETALKSASKVVSKRSAWSWDRLTEAIFKASRACLSDHEILAISRSAGVEDPYSLLAPKWLNAFTSTITQTFLCPDDFKKLMNTLSIASSWPLELTPDGHVCECPRQHKKKQACGCKDYLHEYAEARKTKRGTEAQCSTRKELTTVTGADLGKAAAKLWSNGEALSYCRGACLSKSPSDDDQACFSTCNSMIHKKKEMEKKMRKWKRNARKKLLNLALPKQ